MYSSFSLDKNNSVIQSLKEIMIFKEITSGIERNSAGKSRNWATSSVKSKLNHIVSTTFPINILECTRKIFQPHC